jgi:hypothetical protein
MRDFDLVGGGDLPVKPVTKLPTKGAVLAR